MFDAFPPSAKRLTIDIAAVRDTLCYIESDLRHNDEYARLAETLRSALIEIDRLGPAAAKAGGPPAQAHFRPIDM